MTKQTYHITGTVIHATTKQPLSNLRVEAWDKDLIFDDLVGRDTTDESGAFSITFDESYFKELFLDRRPDLFFKVFEDDELVHDTRDSILWNLDGADKAVRIAVDLSIGDDDEGEYKPDRNQLLELDEQSDKTPKEIASEQPELYQQIEKKVVSRLRRELDRHFEEASEELQTFIDTLNLSFPVRQNQLLKPFLTQSIENSELSDVRKREGLIKAEAWKGPKRSNEMLRPDISLRSNPLFTDEFRSAGMVHIGSLTQLSDQKVDQLLNRKIGPEAINQETLDNLVKDEILDDNEATELGLNANLYQFAGSNVDLIRAVKGAGNGREVSALRNLSGWSRTDWQELLDENDIDLPEGTDQKGYATFLQKQIESLFPHKVFPTYLQSIDTNSFIQNMDLVDPLFAQNEQLFNGVSFSALNLNDIDPQERASVEQAYKMITRQANRYPGLEVKAVLNDRDRSSQEKVGEVRRRISLMAEFYRDHEDVGYLSLDYSPDSNDPDQLDLSNYSEEDRQLIINNLRTNQRMYRITKDAEHAFQLMENGYQAAYQIASDSYTHFKEATGFEDEVATPYYQNARNIAIEVTSKFGSMIDIEKGGLDWLDVDNTSIDVHAYLKEFNGYSELFGSQDYCNCKHCQSIISPAAYFVDLMEYLKTHVLDEYFSEYVRGERGHKLDPRVRRPDLWYNLPLSCENIHTLIPHLTLILEVLENYIASLSGSDFDGEISNRDEVEAYVYRMLYNLTPLNSFRQPFLLPLSKLQTYFEHFPITQVEIAEKVRMYQEEGKEVWAQSTLKLSGREYDLISNPVGEYDFNDLPEEDFLSDLYGIAVPAPASDEGLPDVKRMLGTMDLRRSQFTDLLATDFVLGGADDSSDSEPGVKTITLEGSVQPNREVFENYTPGILDRMHRFVRLWHQLDWSIQELDQLLGHLDDVMEEVDIMSGSGELPLKQIARLHSLQQHLNVSIPEFCALFNRIPTDGSPSLFDRLFNLSTFGDETVWDPDEVSGTFRHPAFRSDLPDPEGPGVRIQHRLLAGLGINDDELVQLIEFLREPLGVDEDTMEFELNLDTLTVLYRHARLSRSLDVTVPELFALLRMSTDIENNYLENLEDIHALTHFADWREKSGYTIKELAKILNGEWGDEEEDPTPAEVSETIVNNIYAEQSLVFSDTAFAYFEGITELQSRAIIGENSSLIEPADIQTYRIADSVSDPETLEPDLTAVTDILDSDQRDELKNVIRDIAATHQKDGAPNISDRVLVGTSDLSLSRSRAVLEDNGSIFEPVEMPNLHWLSTGFNPADLITIPEEVPLRAEKARELLLQHSAGEVIANQLGQELGFSTDKIKRLALLAGYDFQDNDTFHSKLAQRLHGDETETVLEDLIAALNKLTLWFNDDDFGSEELAFIQNNAGESSRIFRIRTADPNEFVNPAFMHIRQTALFLDLLEETEGTAEDLFGALKAFDYEAATPRFNDNEETLDRLEDLLETERGLINSLNQVLDFPGSVDSEGASVNHALEAMDKLKTNVELARYLGVGGEALPYFIPKRYDDLDSEAAWEQEYEDLSRGVEALVTAIRIKYDSEEEWQEVVEPFEDRIRELRRDTLTTYLIHSVPPDDPDRPDLTDRFQTEHDLYNYFLIDTELEGCARTSRAVAGISSLQLYIQRILMNLEQTATGIEPRLKVQLNKQAQDEWEWRKNYRIWEANRKVFLYPENYLEPDLRDNKTPLFEELESELLQQEIDAQTSIDAYSKYMKGFEEIARLKIAGAYHDRSGDRDVLHLFGVTSSDPPIYYYRTVENIYKAEETGSSKGVVWNPWKELDLQIPVKKVSPIVFRGKLYVFWVEITTQPETDMQDGSSTFVAYKHTLAVKFTSMRLDGTWSAPQSIELINDEPFSDGPGVVKDPIIQIARPPIPIYIFDQEEGAVGTDRTHSHEKPVEGYSLTGYRWNQVYPDVDPQIVGFNLFDSNPKLKLVGSGFDLSSHVDLYDLSIGPEVAGSPFPYFGFGLIGGISNPPYLKRLTRDGERISYGYAPNVIQGEAFADMMLYLKNEKDDLTSLSELLRLQGERSVITPANGTFTDAIINVDGDLLYLYSLDYADVPYAIRRIGTTHGETVSRQLFEQGIDGLLDIEFQQELNEPFLPVEARNVRQDLSLMIEQKFDTKGSLGVYFREIFFHIPFLIANHLNSQGKYKDAQRWYHYMFNPTSDKLPEGMEGISDPGFPEEREKREKDRVWQFMEFRNHTLQTLKEQLNDEVAVEAYKSDPFNPHAIARLRLGGYMKRVVMKYVDNLLDWGDHLFAQDTRESVNEATLLYVMASEILGERPAELGDCPEPQADDLTFANLRERMRDCHTSVGSGFIMEVESLTSERQRQFDLQSLTDQSDVVDNQFFGNAATMAYNHPVTWNMFNEPEGSDNITVENRGYFLGNIRDLDLGQDQYFKGSDWKNFHPWVPFFPLPSFGTSLLKQACIFCIPHNEELLEYWDRVEDRLFKIRNCLNIEGIRRQLPLFAPEIDPMLLVRARAEGIPLEDVLDSIRGDLPPYRFGFLITKAKEYAGALQSFGGALLSVLEKKDAEELARIRLTHQQNIQNLTTKLRNQETEAAEANLEALRRHRETVENRRDYYQKLKDNGLIPEERTQQLSKYASNVLLEIATPFQVSATVVAGLPYIVGFSNSTGAEGAKEALINTANTFKSMAAHTNRIGDLAGMEARFARRGQGWKFNLQQAENQLEEIEKKIEAAEIRMEIARQSKEIHEQQKEQLQDKIAFYEDKFTNLGLYTWLSTELKRLYREAYQNVLTIARMAERAYRFERGDDTTSLLDGNYWEASRSGLLAGERMMNDLRNMERLYIETNDRSMEIDQAFSLTQIDPEALLTLKATGSCEFGIPELYFDLFYPGQYRRRIKSARLTIPCVTGPYTNVSATLTLNRSAIRKEPDTDAKLFQVPPTRTTTVATSTAQNDSGVFNLDFRDERYMPFEGAGAVSEWQLRLPNTFRPFDYRTINDVILHISYEAEYDELYREEVEGEIGGVAGEIEDYLNNSPVSRMFSIRQEFSQAFHRILNSEVGISIDLELSEKHFPLFLQGQTLSIEEARLFLEIDSDKLPDDSLDTPTMNIRGNGGSTDVSRFDPVEGSSELYQSASFGASVFNPVNPSAGPLGIELTIEDLGNLGSGDIDATEPSVFDDRKLKDIYLMLRYTIETGS